MRTCQALVERCKRAARKLLAENAQREIRVQLRREREIAHVDALVRSVDQRRALQQRLVALREEPVRDALWEGQRGSDVSR